MQPICFFIFVVLVVSIVGIIVGAIDMIIREQKIANSKINVHH